jgi:hypothetical protein
MVSGWVARSKRFLAVARGTPGWICGSSPAGLSRYQEYVFALSSEVDPHI